MKKEDIDTPAMLADLEAMERNMKDMAEFARSMGKVLRPMVKNHKCPAIAKLQMEYPATIGINTPKLGEAEVLVANGINDIFISNEIVGASKVERLMALTKSNKISVSIDSLVGARGLDAGARKNNIKLEALVHVDSGTKRSGVLPGEPSLGLAKEVSKLDNLSLKGIWTHESMRYAPEDSKPEEIYGKQADEMVKTKRLIEDELGIEVYNSMGSTRSAKIVGKIQGVDEIRPGAYAFSGPCFIDPQDRGQIRNCAMSILSTVFSRPTPDRAICDAGSTAYKDPGEWFEFSREGARVNLPSAACGIVKGLDGKIYDDVQYYRWDPEYGMLRLHDRARDLEIGDLIEIIPYYPEGAELHDEIFGVRNGEVEVSWPILCRGKFR